MKAYERSAFFIHTYIKDFKLSKRYIKAVNMDVVSLGFPENTLPKWLNGYVYDYAADRYTPNTSVIEKSPVYKNFLGLLHCAFFDEKHQYSHGKY